MNMVEVGKGIYIIRTQAGFKKAVKAFREEMEVDCNTEVAGFPKSYPSIVSLSLGYRGYEYIQCTSVHLNAMKKAIEESESDRT